MASNPSSTEPSKVHTSVTNHFDLSPYSSNHFINAWLDVTETLVGPSSDLNAKYKQNRWVLDFLAPKKIPAKLQDARVEFESNPASVIDTLQAFASDFRPQQIGIDFAKRQYDGEIFLYLTGEFKRRLAKTKTEVLKSGAPIYGKLACPSFEMPSPPAGDDNEEYVEHHTKFRKDVDARMHEYDSSNHYSDISTDVTNDHTRWVVMRDLLREADKRWGRRLQNMLFAFRKLIDDELRADIDFMEDEYWGYITGCTITTFVENVHVFTEMMTGQGVEKDLTLKQCFARLSTTGAARIQHLKPLFEQMQTLQKTVDRQRQIITSLEYRRLLEHIPKQPYYIRALNLTSPRQQTGTRFWQAAWKDWVEKELQIMMTTGSAPSPLAELFKYSLDDWKSKKGNQNKTSVHDTNFEEWLCYKRGLQLYGELSSNIHKYDDMKFSPYDIDDSNWSRSERIMLKALKPKHWEKSPDGEILDVNWTKERADRGLDLI